MSRSIGLQRPDLSRRWSSGTVRGDYRNFKSCCSTICRASSTTSTQIRIEAPEFGPVLARVARFDKEYWAVAWLRAESHWEGRENERYAESYKRKFVEQEFNAMTKRYNTQLGDNTKCIVMANKEATSVVGTLDLSFRHFSHGETFPGECVKPPIFWPIERKASNNYAYIANLCVAKSARRQGIAGGMLNYAVLSTKLNGAEKVFVHVHRNNKPAQNLYQKMGFQVF
ncbi:hypothetical protein ACS0TY_012904 [Phlomoides rotata]